MTKVASLAILTAGLALAHPSIVVPQLADGGGWKSTIVVVNTFSLETAHVFLMFRGSQGTRLAFPLENYGLVYSLELDLPPQGSVFLETTGASPGVQAGWMEVRQSTGAVTVKAFAVFRQAVPGRPDFEAVAPGMRVFDSVSFPFDNTNGFVTGFAAVNLANADCTLSAVAMFEESGRSLSTQAKLVAGLAPHGHAAFVSTEKLPELANKRGFVTFSATTLACAPGNLAMLALRFNPSGAFTNLLPLGEVPLL